MYGKTGQVNEGIEYSCKTMQRQLETNTHVLKDFCTNIVHLVEFFNSQDMFAQSLYMLKGAMALLPED